MLTKAQLKAYKRHRHEGVGAQQALAIVRYEHGPNDFIWSVQGDGEDMDVIDGFIVKVRVHRDDYPDLSWIGKYTGQWEPHAIKLHPEENDVKYFIPGNPCKASDYLSAGYSRHNAYLMAMRQNRGDMKRFDDHGDGWHIIAIIVQVFKSKDELASDSLGGIESDSSQAYLDETASDMIAGCLANAKAALAAKQAATVDVSWLLAVG